MSETMEQIQEAVCSHFKVSMVEIIGSGRLKTIVTARQVAMYLCRGRTKHSFTEIGDAFGGKDHTTVMSAANRIAKRMLDADAMLGGADFDLLRDVHTIEAVLDGANLAAAVAPPAEKGRTIMKVKEDGVLLYAIGLSKEDAVFLKWTLFGRQAQRIEAITKRLEWVIETAERDERWAAQRAAGEEPDVG